MDLTLYAIVIGVLSCLLHIAVSGILIDLLVQLIRHNDAGNMNENHIIAASIVLSFVILMILLSLLLVIGAQKRRPDLMAGWIFFTIVGITMSIFSIVFGGFKLAKTPFCARIIYIILQILLWYPVYKLWKNLTANDYAVIVNPPLLVQQASPRNYASTNDTAGNENQRGYFRTPNVI
ncbi:uncharacterized protein LOC131803390 [Musca domestica]|uniref:Uncharacterized protein LOC131803390 n=1 Tax=Musca domestica TaxID=7370 RepID=A0A1I8MQR1_MUSDO|nr:uncharacterized protein LOC131803390 [Musca domestica]XP_058980627.1 uncharacterized protein LOC131803390 [Musca domestica]